MSVIGAWSSVHSHGQSAPRRAGQPILLSEARKLEVAYEDHGND